MDYIIYFFLDCLDTLAIYFLMMAIFHYPIREYLKELFFICIMLALTSIFIREILGYSLLDTSTHVILLLICLRYLIKIRWHRAIRILAVGVLGYFLIQTIISLIVKSVGFIQIDLNNSNYTVIRLIQFTAQIVTYLIAYIIIKFRLGTTKFIRPPHDFYIKEELTTSHIRILFFTSISLMLICLLVFLLLSHNMILIFLIVTIVLFSSVIYLTYRRDRNEHNS